MLHQFKWGLALAATMVLAASAANAEPRDEHAAAPHPTGAAPHPMAAAPRAGEPHPGPSGYQRPAEPQGWNARPTTVDRGAYQHNFQAARGYKIGPYHRPAGFVDRRWAYGQILPRGYWAAQYLLADYWLFGLEVPPIGYEWVRVGSDAVLVNVVTGEILQVEYGVFY